MIKIIESGKDNKIEISDRLMHVLNGTVTLQGDNNSVRIAEGTISGGGMHLEVRNGSSITIGAACNLGNLFVYGDKAAKLTIGDHVGFNGLVRLLMHEKAVISIGNGCLFGSDVEVSISDMHSVVELPSGHRINPPGDVIFGERVWVGQRAMILKNVKLGDGSVVGAASVVTRSVPENSVVAGNPAKVVRTSATWDFHLLDYSDKHP